MKRVLVSDTADEQTIILVSDHGVSDSWTGPTDDSRHVGNIYKGRVINIDVRSQAAFVEFGLEWDGFLHISNVHDSYGDEDARDIDEYLSIDQDVLVQLNRDKRRVNDFSLTTHVSLPGRYVVLMPGTPKFGVSKKIRNGAERKRLRDILRDLDPPSNLGYVIRTEGVNRTEDEIGQDLQYLLTQWRQIIKRLSKAESPSLIYRENDFVFSTLKGVLDQDVDELIFDSKALCRRAQSYLPILAPTFEGSIKLHKSTRPLLQKYGVA